MGSATLGPLAKAVEKALLNMKKGEQCKLLCRSEYAYGEGDVLMYLGLEELYEINDISLAKDKSMMKKQIKEGEGYEKPKECWKALKQLSGSPHDTPIIVTVGHHIIGYHWGVPINHTPTSCQVFLKVEAATDGQKSLPGFVSKTLEFVVGDGCVCDALECAVAKKENC